MLVINVMRLIHPVVVINYHPSSTTLANLVGSVLSHSLNRYISGVVLFLCHFAQIQQRRTSDTLGTLYEMRFHSPAVIEKQHARPGQLLQ